MSVRIPEDQTTGPFRMRIERRDGEGNWRVLREFSRNHTNEARLHQFLFWKWVTVHPVYTEDRPAFINRVFKEYYSVPKALGVYGLRLMSEEMIFEHYNWIEYCSNGKTLDGGALSHA